MIIGLKALPKYFKKDLWRVKSTPPTGFKKHLIIFLRVITIAWRGFHEDKGSLHASALTFFSLLSIVPVLSLVFAIANGFDFTSELQNQILLNFEGQQEITTFLKESVFSQANRMLDNTKGELMAALGFILLFYSVMKLLNNIESSFNTIWGILKARTLLKKITDYLTMIMIAPVLMIMVISLNIFINYQLSYLSSGNSILSYAGPVLSFLIQFTPYVLIWLVFTLIYLVLPNTRVKLQSALIAGVVGGSAFQIFQWAYISFQFGVSRYNAIYGSFAALPLFLIWMQTSWLIVLFGAEISYAIQNSDKYEIETDFQELNIQTQKLLILTVMRMMVMAFLDKKPAFTLKTSAKALKISVRLLQQVVQRLIEMGLVVEIKSIDELENAYQPAYDIHKISLTEVLHKFELVGKNHVEAKNKDAQIIQNSLEKIIREQHVHNQDQLLIKL